MASDPKERILILNAATGIVYVDRTKEVRGDYKKLALLPYGTLKLETYGRISPADLEFILRDVQRYKRGDTYQWTATQTITLGHAL